MCVSACVHAHMCMHASLCVHVCLCVCMCAVHVCVCMCVNYIILLMALQYNRIVKKDITLKLEQINGMNCAITGITIVYIEQRCLCHVSDCLYTQFSRHLTLTRYSCIGILYSLVLYLHQSVCLCGIQLIFSNFQQFNTQLAIISLHFTVTTDREHALRTCFNTQNMHLFLKSHFPTKNKLALKNLWPRPENCAPGGHHYQKF